jgi:hypothetical protein
VSGGFSALVAGILQFVRIHLRGFYVFHCLRNAAACRNSDGDQIITLTGVMTPLSPAKAEFSVIWGCY